MPPKSPASCGRVGRSSNRPPATRAIGLAIVAQQRGYHCVFVCPDKVSGDKIDTLRAYGAEVVVCPTAVAPDDPRSYYSVSDRLAREIPGGWKPNQYANPNNPLSHYETTGPEIWEQTEGRITHFVAGVGTGGTISGVGRYLKEVSSGRVCVIGADPEGSVYSGGTGRPYLVEGVGEDFWPATYDRNDLRRDHRGVRRRLVRDDPAARPRGGPARRRFVRHGGCRRAACGRERSARTTWSSCCCPTVVAGTCRRSSPTPGCPTTASCARPGQTTVGDVLRAKSGETPALVHAHPNETVREAIDILREYGVSQMPVVRAEPPVTAGEVVGSVGEKQLLDALFKGTAALADALERHMSPPLPIIGSGESVTEAVAALVHRRRAARARRRQAGRRAHPAGPARPPWPAPPPDGSSMRIPGPDGRNMHT